MSAKPLENIPKNDTITFKVYYIIYFGNVNYYYAPFNTFRLLLQLHWQEKEERVTVPMVWLFLLLDV